MTTDVVEANHFKIHVAKAKDLPPSWYDLVLRPEKFQQHINTLRGNPYAEPTAMQLITTFLDKAGCIEGGQAVSVPPTEDKREVLVDCALMVASAVVKWDLGTFEKSLPAAVQFALFSELARKYPLRGVPLANEGSDVVMAHVIYNQWVIRFVQQNMKFSSPAPRPLISASVEVTCSNPAQILNIVSPMIPGAVEFLKVLCIPETQLGDELQLPRVIAKLPSVSLNSSLVSVDTVVLPKTRVLCAILYILGTHFFFEDDFTSAYQAFLKCNSLYNSLPPNQHPPFINHSQLRGFLVACEGAAGINVKAGEGAEQVGVANKMEKLRLRDDFEGVGKILLDDLTSREIPSTVIGALEKEVSDWSESLDTMETQAKRPKLNQSDFSRSIPVADRVYICNGLRCVLEGKSPRCRFWQLLSEEKTHHLDYVLHVCGQLVKHKLTRQEQSSLQNFIRGLCCDQRNGTREVWERLIDSSAGQLALTEDLEVYRELFDPLPKLVSPVQQDRRDDSTEIHKLERQVNQAVTSQEVVTAIEKLFQATSPNQHRGIVLQWMGSVSGFAPVESMPDHVILTKYNALVYRALQQKQAKCYRESLELFNASLSLLMAKTTAVSAKVRQGLEDWLQEQVLVVQLLGTNGELVSGGGAILKHRLESKQLAPLLAKSKGYYMNRSSPDTVTLNLAGAFLLNTQDYSFLSSHNTNFEPGKIAPRLATAVMNVKEGHDLRKSIRDLFEAVLSVFSPPLHSGEGKTEVNERQSKLRTNFDNFVENLMDTMALSLVMAALARIWNLLKKPEDEILSEFSSHWPTAIGNPGSVDSNHVFRALSSTLSHALRLQPSMTSWITMKGDLHCAIGDYGAAIENYLQSGAISSDFFESDIPSQTWTPAVYHRMINCCGKLGYHTHAAILCQFLQPVDYELAFGILKNNVESTVDSLFVHFWDMTIIEYLIYIHSKKGDTHKQATAIQVAGQAELNFNNSSEVLERAAQVRKRRFLRAFYTQITNSV